ncbi:hypothetical protein [Parasediminibacterium sp. JCM 36343]|uniref:hypothetical protein n=1 Tax=Parasediminibacterium sp. JCM 36343 TaxID=3374279 RepID=UPI00397BD99A
MKKLLMGSFLLTVFAAAITIIQMSSCHKAIANPAVKTDTIIVHDSVQYCPNAKLSLTGLWIGYYTTTGMPSSGNQYFSFTIKPDSTLVNETIGASVQHFSTGKWQLHGDTLISITTCIYGIQSNIGVKEKHVALFNKNTGTLTSGIWQNYPTPTGGGTFVLTKVN